MTDLDAKAAAPAAPEARVFVSVKPAESRAVADGNVLEDPRAPQSLSPLKLLATILIPTAVALIISVLPYDSHPKEFWIVSQVVPNFGVIGIQAAVFCEFLPALRANGLIFKVGVIVGLLTTILEIAMLLIFGLFPLTFVAACMLFGGLTNVVAAAATSWAERGLRAKVAPAAGASSSDRADAGKAAAASTAPAAPVESSSKRSFYAGSYFGLGPMSAALMCCYLAVYSLSRSPLFQLLCSIGIQVLILGVKEVTLTFATERMQDKRVRFSMALFLEVATDCYSTVVLSATADTTFFVFLGLQFLSMLSYIALLSPRGIALKECLGGGRKTMATRIENAAVGIFTHCKTQLMAVTWYLVCAPAMRFSPQSDDSFPLAAISEQDFARGMRFAAISGGAALLMFLAARWLMRRLHGREADPWTLALRVYGPLFWASVSAAVVAECVALILMLRPARILFWIYDSPGKALLSSAP